MNTHIIYQDNSLRNYNYLLVCPETKAAAIIDPLDADKILTLASQLNVNITTIINTHEHQDHIAGNTAVVKATGAQIIAHARAPIANVDRGVLAVDQIQVGKSIILTVLDTPGHTFSHICLLAEKPAALFCGDTLFNAGCGNVHCGDVELLYQTFKEQLFKLTDETKVYPGHDYLANNLSFAKTREPNNREIEYWLQKAEKHDPHHPIITTIGIEKTINPFFRLSEPEIIQQLQLDFPDVKTQLSNHDVFLRLRELRNKW